MFIYFSIPSITGGGKKAKAPPIKGTKPARQLNITTQNGFIELEFYPSLVCVRIQLSKEGKPV